MTTYIDVPIDFEAIDAEYEARKDSTATQILADTDYSKFVAALEAAVLFGRISQNDLRLHLLEDTVDGPRCSIPHNRYSAFFSRAAKAGLIRKAKRSDGRTLKDVCTTSPTGNNGKDQVVWEWLK